MKYHVVCYKDGIEFDRTMYSLTKTQARKITSGFSEYDKYKDCVLKIEPLQ
jgi:hypothetical protein